MSKIRKICILLLVPVLFISGCSSLGKLKVLTSDDMTERMVYYDKPVPLLEMYADTFDVEFAADLSVETVTSMRLYKDEDYNYVVEDPALIEKVIDSLDEVYVAGIYVDGLAFSDAYESVTFYGDEEGQRMNIGLDYGRLSFDGKDYVLENRKALTGAVSSVVSKLQNEDGTGEYSDSSHGGS